MLFRQISPVVRPLPPVVVAPASVAQPPAAFSLPRISPATAMGRLCSSLWQGVCIAGREFQQTFAPSAADEVAEAIEEAIDQRDLPLSRNIIEDLEGIAGLRSGSLGFAALLSDAELPTLLAAWRDRLSATDSKLTLPSCVRALCLAYETALLLPVSSNVSRWESSSTSLLHDVFQFLARGESRYGISLGEPDFEGALQAMRIVLSRRDIDFARLGFIWNLPRSQAMQRALFAHLIVRQHSLDFDAVRSLFGRFAATAHARANAELFVAAIQDLRAWLPSRHLSEDAWSREFERREQVIVILGRMLQQMLVHEPLARARIARALQRMQSPSAPQPSPVAIAQPVLA